MSSQTVLSRHRNLREFRVTGNAFKSDYIKPIGLVLVQLCSTLGARAFPCPRGHVLPIQSERQNREITVKLLKPVNCTRSAEYPPCDLTALEQTEIRNRKKRPRQKNKTYMTMPDTMATVGFTKGHKPRKQFMGD